MCSICIPQVLQFLKSGLTFIILIKNNIFTISFLHQEKSTESSFRDEGDNGRAISASINQDLS